MSNPKHKAMDTGKLYLTIERHGLTVIKCKDGQWMVGRYRQPGETNAIRGYVELYMERFAVDADLAMAITMAALKEGPSE